MKPSPQRVVLYRDADGRELFAEWHASLADRRAQAAILARMNRLRAGNFGDCKPVGGGVLELRIHHGPGYRVYLGRAGATVVILLCGGDKASQRRDVATAQRYWSQYRETR